jgi:hypothetical protein
VHQGEAAADLGDDVHHQVHTLAVHETRQHDNVDLLVDGRRLWWSGVKGY